MEYTANTPIYIQIVSSIKRFIVSEQWPPGSRVSSVRDLAAEFKVNPNTMQRALAELERDGLIYTERTSGKYVTRDSELIARTRRQMAIDIINGMYDNLYQLGFTKIQINALLNNKVSD